MEKHQFKYSQLSEISFMYNFCPDQYLQVNSFFKSCQKQQVIDRSALDGFAYGYMHGQHYSVAGQQEIRKRQKSHGLRFTKIFDMGGQAGFAFEYYQEFVSLDNFVVVDRWDYTQQKAKLDELGVLPTIHLQCWFEYLREVQPSTEEILFLFSFSINELHFTEQIRVLKLIKSRFPNAHILVLDQSKVINELEFMGDVDDVEVNCLKRPYLRFEDTRCLRRKLLEKRLWL
jgi:hypothetical protein